MIKIIIFVLISLFVMLIPYFVGRIQYNNVDLVIQNFMDNDSDTFEGTDGDIENVLRIFNFNIAWDEEPTFMDYYEAGLEAL